jgi:short-subunit dehydrogenase
MGKVVLITGASMGIGRALALEWARRGANVVLSARSEGPLQQVANEVRAAGGVALAVKADVTQEPERAALVARTLRDLGRLDVLVNNAGRGYYAPTLKVDPETLEGLYRLNVIAPVRMAQLSIESLKESNGTIVMVSSIAGVVSSPRIGPYSSSKFALEALSMSMRAELRSTGVRVLVVRPGPVETPFHENATIVDENIGYRPTGHKPQTAETVARMTVDAVDAGKSVLETSLFVKTASFAARVAPALLRTITKRMAEKSGF